MPSNRELIIATVKENVSLSAFDPATGEVVAVVPVGTKDVSKPHEIAVTRPLCLCVAVWRQGLRAQYTGQ